MPMGLHPPWIYPVRGSSSFCGSMAMLFSPTALAAFFRSSSSATGITNTKCPPEAPVVTSVLKTRSGGSPRAAATSTPLTAPEAR